jgi:hypothetical protein
MRRRGDVVSMRILVAQLLELFFMTAGIVVGQAIRVGLDIPRGILEGAIRMSTDSGLQGRLVLRHQAVGLPVSGHWRQQAPSVLFSRKE